MEIGQGNIAKAEKCFARSLALFQEMGTRHDMGRSLLNLGSIAAGHSPEQAEALFRQSLDMYVELQDDWHIAVVKMAMGNQADRIGEEAFQKYWAEGQAYTPEQVIAYALQGNIDQA